MSLLQLKSATEKRKDDPGPAAPPFPFEIDGARFEIPAAVGVLGAAAVFAWAEDDGNQAMLRASIRALHGVASPACLTALMSLDQDDAFTVVNAWLSDGDAGKSAAPVKSSARTKPRPPTTGGPGSAVPSP